MIVLNFFAVVNEKSFYISNIGMVQHTKGTKWTNIRVLRAVQADHYLGHIIYIPSNNFMLKLNVQDVWQLMTDFTASNQKQARLLLHGQFWKTVHRCNLYETVSCMIAFDENCYISVASLGLVSPGVATEGVTPIFSGKNWRPFFWSLSLLLISLGCHPLEGVTPHLFHPSDLVCPLFIVNSPTKNFSFGVSPLWRVSPGTIRFPSLPLPLVMPLLYTLWVRRVL